jgi:hypothetical protein
MKRIILRAAILLLCAVGFAAPVNPPTLATTNRAGIVMPDNTTITVGAGGVITALTGGTAGQPPSAALTNLSNASSVSAGNITATTNLTVAGVNVGSTLGTVGTVASNAVPVSGGASLSVGILTVTTNFTGRIVPRVLTIASAAAPAINTDLYDCVTITNQAVAITNFTTNLSGTPNNFDKLTIRILDNGTAQTIAWGANFVAMGVPLPATTVISKKLTIGLMYGSMTAKWGCVGVAQEY